MRKTFFVTLAAAALAATASAQIPATLRLSVDEAVSMALEHNVDLNADRLDPQISDTRVAAAAGVFKPTLDGLSLIGGNAHTDREFAVVDSMVPRLYLLTRMIMELGKGPNRP